MWSLGGVSLTIGFFVGMVRQIWLLRHADAEPHGARPDAQRKLTARGEQQARFAGQALSRMAVSFQTILVSPKIRALRTAELALREVGSEQLELMQTHPALASDFDGMQALEALSGLGAGDRLLLVGHEPDMSRVLGDLTGARADVKKGGLAMVRLDGSTGGEIALSLRPHELALIAGERDL